MPVEMKIEVETKPVLKSLRLFKNRMPKIIDKILVKQSQEVILRSRNAYLNGQVLHRRTGALRDSLSYSVNNGTARIFSNSPYAAIHEYGGIIRAKKSPYLHFKIGSNWVKVKEVRMPQRQFLWPAIQDIHEKTTAGRRIANAVLKQEIKKVDLRSGN